MSDPAWGFTYVLHGLGGVGFVGLIIAHIYFALRPEKLWITRSMLLRLRHAARVSRASRSGSLEGDAGCRALATDGTECRLERRRPGRRDDDSELERRVDAIEAGYELMLAYAAQGIPVRSASPPTAGSCASSCDRFDAALTGLADLYRELLAAEQPDRHGGLRRLSRRARRATRAPRRPACASCWRSRASAHSWSTTSTRRFTCARCSPTCF